MRNTIIAGIRSGVQRLAILGLAVVSTWLVARGIDVDLTELTAGILILLDVVLTGLLTSAFNAAEKKWPILTKIMSLGQAASAPEYEKANPEIPKAA
jgi:hypothetical protein